MPHKDKQAERIWWDSYYARNKERIAARNHAAYMRNREKRRAAARVWYENNRKQVIAKEKSKQQQDHEGYKARQRSYYERNKERLQRNVREYQKRHPEKAKEWSRTQHARRRAAIGSWTYLQWIARYGFYGKCCAYCGRSLEQVQYHRDHVIPIKTGGPNWPSNLVPACSTCNHRKHTKRWLPRQPRPHGPLPD